MSLSTWGEPGKYSILYYVLKIVFFYNYEHQKYAIEEKLITFEWSSAAF